MLDTAFIFSSTVCAMNCNLVGSLTGGRVFRALSSRAEFKVVHICTILICGYPFVVHFKALSRDNCPVICFKGRPVRWVWVFVGHRTSCVTKGLRRGQALSRSSDIHLGHCIIIPLHENKAFQVNGFTERGNTMRIILAAVGALGISLIGASGASAISINAAAINAGAGADSVIMQARTGGIHHFGRYPSCKHNRSYDPATRTFIGSNGRRQPCHP